MTSEVSICNQASLLVGGNIILSLDDSILEARLCKAYYAEIRNAVLEDADWRFAAGRKQLAASSTSPGFEYTYQCQVPSDCLVVRDVDDGSDNWNMEWQREGNFILCNTAPIYIKYTKVVEDPSKFSAMFTQALVSRLAADLAVPIAGSRQMQQDMMQLYVMKRDDAASVETGQGRSRTIRSEGRLTRNR